MGTYIALNIGGIDVAWAKNRMGENFGALYEETNRKPLRESTEENDLTGSMAFIRSLNEIIPRLEILGYSLSSIKKSINEQYNIT